MKKTLLSLVFGMAVIGTAFAQDQDSGENLQSHNVQMGETVMVIAKKYKVTPRDIYEYNPAAVEGLSPNTTIQIPLHRQLQKNVAVADSTEEPTVTEPAPVKVEAAKPLMIKAIPVPVKTDAIATVTPEPATPAAPYTVSHEVKPGETLTRLARNYNTTVAAIEKENAARLKNGLRAGQTLSITAKPAPVAEPGYVPHKVAPGETLMGLSRKYSTTVDAIAQSNKTALRRGLQAGQTLMILPGEEQAGGDAAVASDVPPLVEKDKRGSSIAEMAIQHQVKDGETLTGLATKYNTTVENIVKNNKTQLNNGLHAGQVLEIREKNVKDQIMAGRQD